MENKGSFIKKLIITIVIMLFILFCASQKQASALVAKNLTYQPNAIATNNKKGSFSFSGSTNNHWFNIPLQNPYTKTNDFDLIAFRFDALNYHVESSNGSTSYSCTGGYNNISEGTNVPMSWTCTGGSSTSNDGGNGNLITVTGVIWDSSNTARLCYFASDTPSYLFCPLEKGGVVNRIGLYVTSSNISDHIITFDYEINNSFYFYNYESTEIVNSNGVIVQQQQQTNDILSGTDTTGAGTDTTNFFNNNSSQFNSEINTLTNEGDLVNLGVVFLTQIDNSTCQPFNIPIPYTTKSITLPCLGTEFQNKVPLLWTLYTTIITGVIVFRFWTYAIDMIKHLVDPYSTGLTGVTDIAGGGK